MSQIENEIPSNQKIIIKESKFYEKKNIIEHQFLKKNTFVFSKVSNNSETYFFSEKLFLNQNKNENLKKIKFFFSSSNFEKIYFCYYSIVNKKKIEKFFENLGITYEDLSSINNSTKKFNIINLSVNSSFTLNIGNKKILFLSDNDFFKKVVKRKTSTEIHDDNIISEFSQLNFGDLIVHIDHGVGKFNCLTKKKLMILNKNLLNYFITIMINSSFQSKI